MTKLNKLTRGISVALLLAGANVAMAELVSVPATVTVNNAIDFTFTGALDFGEVRATADPIVALCSILEMPANPALPIVAGPAVGADDLAACTGAGVSEIQAVGGTPTRPVFTLAGLAPFTTLDLTLPSAAVTLSATLPPGAAGFQVGNFTAYRTSGTPGTITTTIQADATGGATFTVGAQIATNIAAFAGQNYEDGLPYTGTFDVEVNY